MSYPQRAAAVLYAKDPQRLVAFYTTVASLTLRHSEDDHAVVDSPAFQLVILQIPRDIAQSITIEQPPVRRERVPVKLVFFVENIEHARSAAAELGGGLNPADREWDYQGHKVCDGFDPEGNVFQLREVPGV
jgi:predicted enzyme related to lactoylglutathione lyase